MKTILLLLSMVSALSGCASEPTLTPEQRSKILEPLFCKDKQECDLYWQRTQAWIVKNSHWRIQITTDAMLQTFGPGEDAYPAFTVIRENNPDGSANINMSSSCGNVFGCFPSPIESIMIYKQSFGK